MFPMFPFLVIAARPPDAFTVRGNIVGRVWHWSACLFFMRLLRCVRIRIIFRTRMRRGEGPGISTSTCPGQILIRRTGRSAGIWSSIPIHRAG